MMRTKRLLLLFIGKFLASWILCCCLHSHRPRHPRTKTERHHIDPVGKKLRENVIALDPKTEIIIYYIIIIHLLRAARIESNLGIPFRKSIFVLLYFLDAELRKNMLGNKQKKIFGYPLRVS